MRRLTGILTLWLLLVPLAATAATTTSVPSFEDVPAASPHAEAIAALAEAGVTDGCGDGRYCPRHPVTRDQMAAFLVRALELGPAGGHEGAHTFTDVGPGSAHGAAIEALARAGITGGCGPDRYCPRQQVTRDQMATFLTRAFELPTSGAHRFADVVVGSPHAASINGLAAAGITGGCSEDHFCPRRGVTRDQMASFLARGLGLAGRPDRKPGTPSPSTDPHRQPSPRPHTDPIGDEDRILSGDVVLDGFTVPAGQVWAFDPDTTTTVRTTANVVVEGVLRMRPASANVTHTLKFTGINETAFVGGGMEVLDTDVGLWVVEDGQLDLQGTQRAGWNRTGADPTWRDGDEVRRAPVEPGVLDEFPRFAPGDSVPSVTAPDGSEHHAEVFNLTRNVRVHGGGSNPAEVLSDDGRAHVICLACNKPQTMRHVELRWMAPRMLHDRDGTTGRLGRYALHFHHAGHGTRGSIVEGTVVRDAGGHGYVPHGSHGITFTDTIVYDTFGSGYWWDADDHTDDVLYDRAAVFLQHAHPSYRGYGLHGFTLGEGNNMVVRDSVVVGNHGRRVNAGGFMWPDHAHDPNNKWVFERNVAHNNRGNGIGVWQNRSTDHVVTDFTGFHNGEAGISHGAYLNQYTYTRLLLFGNGWDIDQHALAASEPLVFADSDVGSIRISRHTLASSTPTRYRNMRVRDGVTVNESDKHAGVIEFRYDCDHADRLLSTDDFTLIEVRSDLRIVDECTGKTTVLHDTGRGF